MYKQINILLLKLVLLFSAAFFSGQASAQDEIYDTVVVTEPYTDSRYDSSLFNPSEQKAVDVRRVDQAELDKLKKDDAFWYVNQNRKEEEKKEKEATPQGKKKTVTDKTPVWEKAWFKTVMWILIGLTFIAIIIMFLSASDVFVFKKKAKKVKEQEDEEEMPEDIFAIPYEKEIQRAIAAKDYRLAIRYLYLRTLKDLTDNGIIHYKQDKTNQDYVMQLFGTTHYKSFFQLTRHFEYAWYGKFEIATESFNVVYDQFKNFNGGKPA